MADVEAAEGLGFGLATCEDGSDDDFLKSGNRGEATGEKNECRDGCFLLIEEAIVIF